MHPHEDELHLRHLERTCAALDGLSCVLLETQQELQAKIGRLGQSLRSFQTQQQRRLSERERMVNRQTTLLEALPAAMAVLDAADRVIQANAAARRLLGTPLYGLTWMQIQHRVFAVGPEHALCHPQGHRFRLLRQRLPGEPGEILLFTPLD